MCVSWSEKSVRLEGSGQGSMQSLRTRCIDVLLRRLDVDDDVDEFPWVRADSDTTTQLLEALVRFGRLRNRHLCHLMATTGSLVMPSCPLLRFSRAPPLMAGSAIKTLDLTAATVDSVVWLGATCVERLVLRDALLLPNDRVLEPWLRCTSSLRELVLAGCNVVTDDLVTLALATQPRLTKLDVSGTCVRWADVAVWRRWAPVGFSYTATGATAPTLSVFPSSDALECLSVARTLLTDDSVNFLTRGFPNLTLLDMSGNRLLTNLACALVSARLPKLRTLHLGGKDAAHVTDEGIRMLAASKHLQTSLNALQLSADHLTEKSMLYLLSAFTLERFDCARFNTTAASLFLMGKYYSSLVELALQEVVNCTQASLDEIGRQCVRLTTLTLLDLPAVESLDNFATTQLQSLLVKRCPKLANVGALVARSAALASFMVDECPALRCNVVAPLAAHRGLVQLGLGLVEELTGDSLRALVLGSDGIPALTLKRLQLDRCGSRVTTADVATVLRASAARTLTHLSLCWNAHMGDLGDALPAVLRHCDLWGCSSLTDATVAAVASRCPLLETFSVPSTPVSNAALRLLIRCTLLSSLTVSYTGVDDATLQFLCGGLPHLRVLNVSGCAQLTSACVESGLALAGGLRALYMSYCEGLLCAGLVMLVVACPGLVLVKISHDESYAQARRLIRTALLKLQPHMVVLE